MASSAEITVPLSQSLILTGVVDADHHASVIFQRETKRVPEVESADIASIRYSRYVLAHWVT